MPDTSKLCCKVCGEPMPHVSRWWIFAVMDTIRGAVFLIGKLTAPPAADENPVCSETCARYQLHAFMHESKHEYKTTRGKNVQ